MEYYIVAAGVRCGPFTTDQLRLQDIGPATWVWCQGMPAWARADSVPRLQELLQTMPPPLANGPPPPILTPVAPPSPTDTKPWNPVAVAWPGLLFTPFWSAVLAAINSRRLRLGHPWWRPVGVVLAYLAVDLLVDNVVDSNVVSVLLYLGASWLVWQLELRRQVPAFAEHVASHPGATAGWGWPAVAGVPLALVAFLGFVVEPLRPLEPREVCERFTRASSPGEAAKYTTAKLRPALEALAKMNNHGDIRSFELTDEGPAPADVGGYLVGHRTVLTENGRPVAVEGVFHLVHWSGEWRIEDVYFTQYNQQPLARWVALSSDFPQMLDTRGEGQQPGAGPPGPVKESRGGQASSGKSGWEEPGAARGAFITAKLFFAGGKKAVVAVVVVLAVIGSGLSSLWRKLTRAEQATIA